MSTNSPSLSPLGQAAIAFARRGWFVFPCNHRNGRPLVVGEPGPDGKPVPKTGGLHQATRDEEQIAAWWRQWPRAQIGLNAGASGLLLIDFDPRTDPAVPEVIDEQTGEVLREGVEEKVWSVDLLKAALMVEMGVALPDTLTSQTPSNGEHKFFLMPDGEPIGNRGNLPDHIDVRGQGGYVIVPPSERIGDLESGGSKGPGPYTWLHGDWADVASIAPAPPELVRILREPKKKRDGKGGKPVAARRAGAPAALAGDVDDDVRKYALAALDGECRDIARAGSGQRNAQLNEGAFKVATLVAAGALSEAVARAAIEGAARSNPGHDDDRQLIATIDSGWTAGLQSPRDLAEIAAASRARRERGPPRQSSRGSPPAPGPEGNGKPSSQMGATGGHHMGKGSGGEDLARECAFLPQTDLGNLQRFLRRYGRDFLFVEQWGWLAWDGRRWNRDMAVSLLGRAVQDTVRAIQEEATFVRESGIAADPPADADDAQLAAHAEQQKGRHDRVVLTKRDGTTVLLSETISKWGRTSEGAGHIASLPKMAEARITARPADFDADPLLVNMANGTLSFVRGEDGRSASVKLVDPRREDLITKIGTAAFVPAARCPSYDAFLERVQPKAEMREFLDVWAGYNMLGDASAQKMAIFYGEGANGKGVWINTKRAILGDYAWAASINTFMEADRSRKGSDASPDLAALAGRRMVYANEAEEGSKLSDGLVKELTSDEPKGGVRELMKPPFELIITFKNTIIANNKPRIGTDHGIRRRMQLVPWDVIIPHEHQDPLLKAKLVKESSGILNRMVAGALQYLTTGLPLPETIKEATEAYLDENDILGKFLALCIERVQGETMGSSALHELFAAWQTWAQLLPASGKPWSPKYLGQQLERKNFHKRKSSSMVWSDVWPLYVATDFVREGRAVETDLPAPRHKDGRGSPPAPPEMGDDYDDLPP
ncbi:phage/plasmid primase, P4 family [Sphingomonas sp. 2SG]|uniref:phage/plasmid primase, P4 family n=1 Tax=Sphingomonas sp. 2SG TaxID=2502201 RepID=UPI001484CAF4|nr:phage/plasmid primase, P4 family [Sphingomonas sp. 2SG]